MKLLFGLTTLIIVSVVLFGFSFSPVLPSSSSAINPKLRAASYVSSASGDVTGEKSAVKDEGPHRRPFHIWAPFGYRYLKGVGPMGDDFGVDSVSLIGSKKRHIRILFRESLQMPDDTQNIVTHLQQADAPWQMVSATAWPFFNVDMDTYQVANNGVQCLQLSQMSYPAYQLRTTNTQSQKSFLSLFTAMEYPGTKTYPGSHLVFLTAKADPMDPQTLATPKQMAATYQRLAVHLEEFMTAAQLQQHLMPLSQAPISGKLLPEQCPTTLTAESRKKTLLSQQ